MKSDKFSVMKNSHTIPDYVVTKLIENVGNDEVFDAMLAEVKAEYGEFDFSLPKSYMKVENRIRMDEFNSCYKQIKNIMYHDDPEATVTKESGIDIETWIKINIISDMLEITQVKQVCSLLSGVSELTVVATDKGEAKIELWFNDAYKIVPTLGLIKNDNI